MPHTPGPWQASHYDNEILRGDRWAGKEEVVGHHRTHSVIAPRATKAETVLVCEINQTARNPFRPSTDAEADARLIAAAPELLGALETLATGLQWRIDNEPTGVQECDHDALRLANAVIDKAKGNT